MRSYSSETSRKLDDIKRGFAEIRREMRQEARGKKRDNFKSLRRIGDVLSLCEGFLSHPARESADASPLSSDENAKLDRWVGKACSGDGRGLHALRRWCASNPESLSGIECINEALVEELVKRVAGQANTTVESIRASAVRYLRQWLNGSEPRDVRIRADHTIACWLYAVAWTVTPSIRVTENEREKLEELESVKRRLGAAIKMTQDSLQCQAA